MTGRAATAPAEMPRRALEWVAAGTQEFQAAVRALGDEEFVQPCTLPGWTRAHLVAHVARNAEALVNLLTWARTGVESPMYGSADQRVHDIEQGALAPPAQLRALLAEADGRLTRALAGLPTECWAHTVRTARGRLVPAAQVPWMRVREVWVHTVDLDVGFGFSQVDDELCAALLDDVAAGFAGRDDVPAVILLADNGRAWRLGEAEMSGTEADAVSGPLTSLAAYATGRVVPTPLSTADAAGAPALPAWL